MLYFVYRAEGEIMGWISWISDKVFPVIQHRKLHIRYLLTWTSTENQKIIHVRCSDTLTSVTLVVKKYSYSKLELEK